MFAGNADLHAGDRYVEKRAQVQANVTMPILERAFNPLIWLSAAICRSARSRTPLLAGLRDHKWRSLMMPTAVGTECGFFPQRCRTAPLAHPAANLRWPATGSCAIQPFNRFGYRHQQHLGGRHALGAGAVAASKAFFQKRAAVLVSTSAQCSSRWASNVFQTRPSHIGL
jgi:hypothetical protein